MFLISVFLFRRNLTVREASTDLERTTITPKSQYERPSYDYKKTSFDLPPIYLGTDARSWPQRREFRRFRSPYTADEHPAGIRRRQQKAEREAQKGGKGDAKGAHYGKGDGKGKGKKGLFLVTW